MMSMSAIPNTFRRGAIYWFRRSRRLPCGKVFRPTLSLRTACAKTARIRAALLAAKFEALSMRLFTRRDMSEILSPEEATAVFEVELRRALDQIEAEHSQARYSAYDYVNIRSFLNVHEAVYRYLAEHGIPDAVPDYDDWCESNPQLDLHEWEFSHKLLQNPGWIYHVSLDTTAEILDEFSIPTTCDKMDHGWRIIS
jgi:hypothetical protein